MNVNATVSQQKKYRKKEKKFNENSMLTTKNCTHRRMSHKKCDRCVHKSESPRVVKFDYFCGLSYSLATSTTIIKKIQSR